jgi:heterodisulfide reductase subunit B
VEIFETKDEQGSSHGNDENDEFLENEKKGRMPADTRSKKLKNFLSCVQGCILTLEKQNLLQIENEAVINFINSERKCTKKMFESLFQDQEARRVLARVFNNKELHRQLQLTVMSVESRKLYLS